MQTPRLPWPEQSLFGIRASAAAKKAESPGDDTIFYPYFTEVDSIPKNNKAVKSCVGADAIHACLMIFCIRGYNASVFNFTCEAICIKRLCFCHFDARESADRPLQPYLNTARYELA
jgi:hypothetical protein